MSAPPLVTPGQGVNLVRQSVSLARALHALKQERDETAKILRGALARALAPDLPGSAEKLAGDIEQRMWERQPAPKEHGFLKRRVHGAQERVRGAQGRLDARFVDWPDWRDELQRWVVATVDEGELQAFKDGAGGPRAPRNPRVLGRRLPDALLDELREGPKEPAFRLELYQHLLRAEELRHAEARATGAAGGGLAVAIAGVGSALADPVSVVDQVEIAVAVAGAASIVAITLGDMRRRRSRARREQVRRFVRDWVVSYEHAIVRGADGRPALDLIRRDVSRRLIPCADGTGDHDLVESLRDLEDVLIRAEWGDLAPDDVQAVLKGVRTVAAGVPPDDPAPAKKALPPPPDA